MDIVWCLGRVQSLKINCIISSRQKEIFKVRIRQKMPQISLIQIPGYRPSVWDMGSGREWKGQREGHHSTWSQRWAREQGHWDRDCKPERLKLRIPPTNRRAARPPPPLTSRLSWRIWETLCTTWEPSWGNRKLNCNAKKHKVDNLERENAGNVRKYPTMIDQCERNNWCKLHFQVC